MMVTEWVLFPDSVTVLQPLSLSLAYVSVQPPPRPAGRQKGTRDFSVFSSFFT